MIIFLLAGQPGAGSRGRRRDFEVVILKVGGSGEQGDDDAERYDTDNGQERVENNAFHGSNCERDGRRIMTFHIDFWKCFCDCYTRVLE